MAELAGLQALVVEDEWSVALLIESMLEELGCEVVMSVPTLTRAISAAKSETFDFAILDVNLGGQLVFPVVEVLQERNLPFLFSTGYGRAGIPEKFNGCEILSKPFTAQQLERKLRSALRKGET